MLDIYFGQGMGIDQGSQGHRKEEGCWEEQGSQDEQEGHSLIEGKVSGYSCQDRGKQRDAQDLSPQLHPQSLNLV